MIIPLGNLFLQSVPFDNDNAHFVPQLKGKGDLAQQWASYGDLELVAVEPPAGSSAEGCFAVVIHFQETDKYLMMDWARDGDGLTAYDFKYMPRTDAFALATRFLFEPIDEEEEDDSGLPPPSLKVGGSLHLPSLANSYSEK
jgi:hypothetical protein